MQHHAILLTAAFLSSIAPPILPRFEDEPDLYFADPIDAISFGLPGEDTDLEVSYKTAHGTWSAWETMMLEDEQDPLLTETNLVIFPTGVSALRVRGADDGYVAHPIRVEKGPAKVEVAASTAMAAPKILSRGQWGADESLLFTTPQAKHSDADVSAGDNAATASSQRIRDCQNAQLNYPEQFAVTTTMGTDASGRHYKWPLSYSKSVNLLVVHHTALYVSDDNREPAERMRALYQYHAKNRGWGDVGYNYIIDERGQIYEGRTGGRYVVGGHAYCNNVGTIGVALMGNFDLEQPSQSQMQSLQWLLKELSVTYGINPATGVEHHGKKFLTPIVGHRDLVPTDCPGYHVYSVMAQITSNVRNGKVDAVVKFPGVASRPSSSSSSSSSARALPVTRGITQAAEGLSAVGRTSLTLAPGAKQRISLTYVAPPTGIRANGRIAQVALSSSAILLSQEDGARQIPIKTSLASQYDVPGGDMLEISLLLQAPWDVGTYWFEIGGIKYTLQTAGRRSRAESYVNPFEQRPSVTPPATASVRRVTRPPVVQPSSVPRVSSSRSSSAPPFVSPVNTSQARIRLSASAAPTVWFENGGTVDGKRVLANDKVRLTVSGNSCRAQVTGVDTSAAILMLKPAAGVTTVDAVNGRVRRYRGAIECRVIDGQIVLINEIGLEDYMRGLAEEPDTEPYEKQRAIAVAARSYMAYYMQPDKRKFPGMPYDGTDSPATFQLYAGYDLEIANPMWVKAVNSVNGQVLTFNNQIVRAPYFSSNDGVTRTPEQAGWNNFPFSQELFRAKPDPWCKGMPMAGHGVGMSGCGSKGQANEGKTAEQILQYYYPGTVLRQLR